MKKLVFYAKLVIDKIGFLSLMQLKNKKTIKLLLLFTTYLKFPPNVVNLYYHFLYTIHNISYYML